MSNVVKCSVIFALCLLLWVSIITLLIDFNNWDAVIAQRLYNPCSAYGYWVRDHTQYIVITISFVLFILMYTRTFRANKFFMQMSAVWLLTLILGVILTINVVLKISTERPRPKETEILTSGGFMFQPVFSDDEDEQVDNGKSFPSGHSSMGFLFMSPFFLLALKRRFVLSAVFLSLGLFCGTAIGYGRMLIGAHFLTDVMWAGVVIFLSSIVSALIVLNYRKIQSLFCRGIYRFKIYKNSINR